MADFYYEAMTQLPGLMGLFVFVFGACVGSFLNVCIYRIPQGRSIVHPGSRCACGRSIAWYDNLPILSWFILRGRARCCGRSFSIRYPAVEALTGGLFLTSWLVNPPPVALAGMVLVGLLLPASLIDWDTMEIPDCFSVGGMIVGMLVSFAIPDLHGAGGSPWLLAALRSFIISLQGALIGSALVMWVSVWGTLIMKKEAMGFGDVKLMGCIGAFCGWQGAVFSLFGGALIGCLAFLVGRFAQSILHRHGGEELAGEGDPSNDEDIPPDGTEIDPAQIPFGPSLAAAAVLHFFFLHPYVEGYFRQFEILIP